jgi:hypothetical protein
LPCFVYEAWLRQQVLALKLILNFFVLLIQHPKHSLPTSVVVGCLQRKVL